MESCYRKKSLSPRGRKEFLNEQNVSLEIQEGGGIASEAKESSKNTLDCHVGQYFALLAMTTCFEWIQEVIATPTPQV